MVLPLPPGNSLLFAAGGLDLRLHLTRLLFLQRAGGKEKFRLGRYRDHHDFGDAHSD